MSTKFGGNMAFSKKSMAKVLIFFLLTWHGKKGNPLVKNVLPALHMLDLAPKISDSHLLPPQYFCC